MQRVLDNGLILRSLSENTEQDRENRRRFYGKGGENENAMEIEWVDDLSDPTRPSISLDDSWVVVDPQQDERVVAVLLLIPQRWRYEDIDLPVGRIEAVATHEDYRRRGLMRALMEAAHERSEALGHPLQVITGRPGVYRPFGYTQAVARWQRAQVPVSAIESLPDGEQPQFSLRPATDADIPNLMEWEAYCGRHRALTCARTAEEWHYELHRTRSRQSRTEIIVRNDGTDVGYLALTPSGGICYNFVVGERSSHLQTFEDVMRGMLDCANRWEAEAGNAPPTHLIFDEGLQTTLGKLLDETYPAAIQKRPSCWHLRAASPARLINHIAPVLERRLLGSGANCYSGRLKISYHNGRGLELIFDEGKISACDIEIREEEHYYIDASFTHDALLNLVFGHNTLDEVARVLPDTSANRTAAVLFKELFPVKASQLWAIW